MSDWIYLDHHSATSPFPESVDILCRSLKDYFAEASAPHFLGQQQVYPLEKGVKNLIQTLGAEEEDLLVFHEGGAEATHHIFLNTYLNVTRETGKTLFLTTAVEDTFSIQGLKKMQELGCLVKAVPLNAKGQVTREALLSSITPKTAIFSLSWANGLTGVIQPIADLAAVCKEKNILFHVEASYMLGKSFFRFQDLGVDFLSLDGSLIHAPKKTGLTLAKKNVPFSVLQKVGESTAHRAALGHSIFEVQERFEHYCMEIARLRDRFEEGVVAAVPFARVLFKEADRLPTCTAIAFLGVHAESLLYLLNAKGVYATLGEGRFQALESILLSIGVGKQIAGGALSFSLAWDTKQEEIDRAIEIVISCVNQIKASSIEESI